MKLKVTIDVFSGRENPSFILDSAKSKKFMNVLNPGSGLKDASKAAPPPFTLGYRGIIVEQIGEPTRDLPGVMQIADGIIYSGNKAVTASDESVENFVLENLDLVKDVKLEKGFKSRLLKEMNEFKILKEELIIPRIKWPIKLLCGCAPLYEPDWWNNNPTIKPNNNCYNYACNYRTDTFAQPGKATGNQYTSLSGCTVAAGQKSAKDGAISDCLIDNPTANNKCPAEGHLVALVIAPGWDFHWYRKGRNGYWSHKPGGTSVTNLDNSGNLIPDPRTANRGPYTQFCTFMTVMHGHIKIK